MRGARSGLTALALAATFGVQSLARAETPEAARVAFQAGVEAFQRGDYEAALAKFQEADAAGHVAAITYNIGRAYEALERPDEAVRAYEAYIAEAGEAGEFAGAATVAIVQLKARSTRLRIDSTPPGAEVTLDGRRLRDKTPLTVLVARGEHAIVLTHGDWVESRTVTTSGDGSSADIVFVRSPPAGSAPVPAASPEVAPAPRRRRTPPTPPAERAEELEGLTGSAGLSLSLYRFVGRPEEESAEATTTATSSPGGITLGLAFDAGWALSPKTALLLRGFGGLGSSAQAVATIGAAGPVVSYRLGPRWWAGGGLVLGGGRADSDAREQDGSLVSAGETVTAETDVAIGPSLELSYALDVNEGGHWLISLLPTALFTTSGEESTLFVPMLLGYRWL